MIMSIWLGMARVAWSTREVMERIDRYIAGQSTETNVVTVVMPVLGLSVQCAQHSKY